MICKSVEIIDFRNIPEAKVNFCDGVNILYGDNAQGKTSLLEAVRFAGSGKSFRAGKENEMIRFGCEGARVSLDFCDRKREQNITVRIFKDARHRQMEQNGMRLHRLSEAVGAFQTVLFCPEHLQMIKEGPSHRRNFLDVALSSLYPPYLVSLQRFQKILKERNKLLSEMSEGETPTDKEILYPWSEGLAVESALLSRYRVEYIQKMRRYVSTCFASMTGESEVPELFYLGGIKQFEENEYLDTAASEKAYLERILSHTDKEIIVGTSLCGAQKDDICVELNGHAAREYASQGQQRSLALAFKLAEGQICREENGEEPVYLFDDVLSELDAGRRNYLLSELGGKQVILTACDPGIVSDAKIISVENGTFTERN